MSDGLILLGSTVFSGPSMLLQMALFLLCEAHVAHFQVGRLGDQRAQGRMFSDPGPPGVAPACSASGTNVATETNRSRRRLTPHPRRRDRVCREDRAPWSGRSSDMRGFLTPRRPPCQARRRMASVRLLKREQVPTMQPGARPGPGHKHGCTLGSGHPGRSSRGSQLPPLPTWKPGGEKQAALPSSQLAPRVNIPTQKETDSSRQEEAALPAGGCPALALGGPVGSMQNTSL